MMLKIRKKEIVTILVAIAAILTIVEQLWKGRWGVKVILDLFPAKIDTFWLVMLFFVMILLLVNYERIPLLGRKYKGNEKEINNSKSNSKRAKKIFKMESEDIIKLEDKIKKCNEQYKQLKSELEDKTKEHNDLIAFHESDLKKKVQLTDCDIKLHYKEENPKLTITQNLINMSYDKVALKSLFLYVVADGVEIDKIVYDSENATLDLGKKIFVSDLPPYEINCWITCETTKLLGVMSNYHREKMRIEVDGEICFFVQSGMVTKKIKKTKDLEIGTKEI